MFKKLFIFGLMITSLFGVRELTDENFKKATNRGLVAVEFWATWMVATCQEEPVTRTIIRALTVTTYP